LAKIARVVARRRRAGQQIRMGVRGDGQAGSAQRRNALETFGAVRRYLDIAVRRVEMPTTTVLTATELTTLKNDIEQLQAGLNSAIERLRGLNGGELPNGRASSLATAEKWWTDVKQQAQQIGHEIEERPLVSAMTAFGAGIALGLLVRRRPG
jgi:ElaB/YqjD/DUF883 family membrane-anchored ribosome-binding protein